MNRTTVVNIQHEPFDVYCGRPGKGVEGPFGNPHRTGHCPCGERHTRTQAIRAFRTYFLERVREDPVFRRAVLALKGKRLGCFCAPRPCHVDVIAAWVDAQDTEPLRLGHP